MSAADEIAKLAALRDAGELTQEQFEAAKAKVLATPAAAETRQPPSPEPAVATPTSVPQERPKRKVSTARKVLFWGLLIIVVVTVVIALIRSIAGGPSKSSAGSSGAAAALSKYFAQAESTLALCTAGIDDTQVALAPALSSSATSSDYVTLYSAASQSKSACSYSVSTFTHFDPPSGYPSLNGNGYDGFGNFLQHWAQTDNGKVLGDIETIANDPTSTAGVANLFTDSQQADADATAIESAAKTAATKAGIEHFSGLSLPIWDLHPK